MPILPSPPPLSFSKPSPSSSSQPPPTSPTRPLQPPTLDSPGTSVLRPRDRDSTSPPVSPGGGGSGAGGGGRRYPAFHSSSRSASASGSEGATATGPPSPSRSSAAPTAFSASSRALPHFPFSSSNSNSNSNSNSSAGIPNPSLLDGPNTNVNRPDRQSQSLSQQTSRSQLVSSTASRSPVRSRTPSMAQLQAAALGTSAGSGGGGGGGGGAGGDVGRPFALRGEHLPASTADLAASSSSVSSGSSGPSSHARLGGGGGGERGTGGGGLPTLPEMLLPRLPRSEAGGLFPLFPDAETDDLGAGVGVGYAKSGLRDKAKANLTTHQNQTRNQNNLASQPPRLQPDTSPQTTSTSGPLEGVFARQRLQNLQDVQEARRKLEERDRSLQAERFRKASFFGSESGARGAVGREEEAEEEEGFFGGGGSGRGEQVGGELDFGIARLAISTAPSNPTAVSASAALHAFPSSAPMRSNTHFAASPVGISPASATSPPTGGGGGLGGLRGYSTMGMGSLPPGAGHGSHPRGGARQQPYDDFFGNGDEAEEDADGADLDRRNSFFGPSPGLVATKEAPGGGGAGGTGGRRGNFIPGGLPALPSFGQGPPPGDRQVRGSQSYGKLRKDRPEKERKDRVVSDGTAGHSRGDSFFGLPASPTFPQPPHQLPPLQIPGSQSTTNYSRPSGGGPNHAKQVSAGGPGPSASPAKGGGRDSPKPGFTGPAGFAFGAGSGSPSQRHEREASDQSAKANGNGNGPTSFYGLDRQSASQQHGILPSSSSGSGSGSAAGEPTARHDRLPSAGVAYPHRSSSPAGTGSWGQGSGSGSGSVSVSASIGSRGLTGASRPGSLYNEPGYVSSGERVVSGYQSGTGYQYGGGGGGGSRAASVMMPPVQVQTGPLLDHSHLQPGAKAKLLDYTKTLELYRANAKKTNDPAVMFEFACFLMDVVKEMGDEDVEAESDTSSSKENRKIDASRGDKPGAAKRKTSGPGVLEKPTIGGTTLTASPRTKKEHEKADLIAESMGLLQKLATRGHVDSQFLLADCYTQAIGTPKGKRDFDKAFPLFVLAAKHGHTEATFRAGQCCENGWGTRKEKDKAVTFYRKAAVAQYPPAMYRLGLAEMNGDIGLSKKPKEGVKWLKRAAEAADESNPKPLHELALLHERGIENVLFVDYEYAAELLARAAELQYAPSAYKLGECYEYGRMGCPQDSALSIHYYNIAAQLGHREACFALTAWYLVGSPGVLPQSDTEAYLWAKKAAELELAKAEYAVGYFTEVGIGTVRDPRDAAKWFRKAAEHGDKRAAARLRSGQLPGPGASHGRDPVDPMRRHKEYIGREMDRAKKSKDKEDCVIM